MLYGFRGVVAPASLKRQLFSLVGYGLRCFRGVVAPASLKHTRSRKRKPGLQEFPGRCCPGLIEAELAEDCATPPAAVSGALLPRPH